MADVITRFKLETTQFDSKLRDTSKALADYTRQATLAGKEFDKFTRENVEAARSFGNIATSATNSKDKVNELVSAFNDVAKVYNNLTKEQQQSDFGKALGESMQNLSGRIREAKAELNSTPGLLEKLKEKFVINIDAIKLFNVGLSAAKGALDVAKNAFFASEENIDNWGRTVETGQAIYEGFLTAINTGDISGYLSRIDQITQAARDAYDELDRLSTQKAIDNPRAQAQRVENERLRAMLRTGRYIAPNDGRKATMADGTVLTPEQKQRIASMLENGMKTANSIVASEIKQTTRAINALYKEQASVMGMSEKEFRKGTASMEEFNKRLEGYKQYRQFEREHTIYDGRSIVGHRDKAVNPYAEYAAWGVFKDDGNLFQRIQELINQRAGLQSQNYANTAQAYRAINTGTRTTGGGGGATTTPVVKEITEMQSNQQRINELTQEYVNISDKSTQEVIDRQAAIREEIRLLEERNSKLKLYQEQAQGRFMGGDVQTTGLTGEGFRGFAAADLNVKGLETDKLPTTKLVKDGNSMADAWKDAASAVQSVGDAFNQIKDPTVQASALVAKAIATIALGFAQATEKASATGIFGWIASLTAGAASMMTAIGAIHSATGYANGGQIKGNSYSGDNILALGPSGQFIGLNAGEIVLNKAQTNHLAADITNRDNGRGNTQPYVTGSYIYLGLKNFLEENGYGTLVTTNSR